MSDDGRAPRSRREVLAGAVTVGTVAVGTVAVGLVAAGCSAGGPSAAPASGAPGASTPGTGSGATGTVLGAAGDVPVGGGKVYQELEVVVTQPSAGEYRGLSAICTHTACIVNAVTDGEIVCPCHGSRYKLDGTVATGPAPRPLQARPVTVENGQIVLT